MADINFRTRMLDLMGKDMLIEKNETMSDLEYRLKGELFNLIDKIQDD